MNSIVVLLGISSACALLGTGCASAKKRAGEQLEKGNFEAAAELYEKALASEPGDPEVLAALPKARDGALSNRLIDVRRSRAAGNQEQALEQLLAVLDVEKKWNHFPKSTVGFTQNEEVGLAFPYVQMKVRGALQQKFPLLGETIHQKYAPLFSGAELAAKHEALFKEVVKAGKDSCRHFEEQEKKQFPYFSDFVQTYCSHWGESTGSKVQDAAIKLNELYGSLKVEGAVQGLAQDLVDAIEDDLQSALQQTPWFDNKGQKKGQFKLTGTYSFAHTKDLTNLVHTYKVQEPYQVVEMVTKSREVPYQATETTVNPQTGATQTVQVNRTRTEYYQEPQNVVKYREATRQYPYNAIKHVQTSELALFTKGKLGSRDIGAEYGGKLQKEGYQHDLSNPEVGLAPSRPDLVEPHQWVRQESQKFKEAFRAKLLAEWTANFCTPESAAEGLAASGDRVQKCARSKPAEVPSFVADWFSQHLGVSMPAALDLLSRAAGGR